MRGMTTRSTITRMRRASCVLADERPYPFHTMTTLGGDRSYRTQSTVIPQNRQIGRARHVRERLAGAATEDGKVKAALQNYHARMQRVLDHIDQHLDDDLGLEALSNVAAFS